MPPSKVVNEAELGYDSNYDRWLLVGKAFTGHARRHDADGHLECEIPHSRGWWNGVLRGWYPSGLMSVVSEYQMAAPHGIERRWRPDGSIELDAIAEFGKRLVCVQWDNRGEMTGREVIEPTTHRYTTLQNLRRGYRDRSPTRRFVRRYVERPPDPTTAIARSSRGKTRVASTGPGVIAFEWYPAGRAKSEVHTLGGVMHGLERRWRADGFLELDAIHEYGVCVARFRWDGDDELVERYVIDPASTDFAELQRRRAAARAAS